MKILCVRIGDLYGPEYETYLESKLPEHEFVWIREEVQPGIKLQWNKLISMTWDTDEPVCVMDIDILLINDYHKIFDYPIERGQFLAMPGWWRDWSNIPTLSHLTINGGFYKFYPKDCKYIYDKFMSDPEYWQNYYINNGISHGPVGGEQHFVCDTVNERLELITFPDAWITTFDARETSTMREFIRVSNLYKKLSGNDFMYSYKNKEFHSELKMIHFTFIDNQPHLWDQYYSFA